MIVFTRKELEDEDLRRQLYPEYNYLPSLCLGTKKKYGISDLMNHVPKPRLLHLLTLLGYKHIVCNAFKAVLTRYDYSLSPISRAVISRSVLPVTRNILNYLQTLQTEDICRKLDNTYIMLRTKTPEEICNNPALRNSADVFNYDSLQTLLRHYVFSQPIEQLFLRYNLLYYSYLYDNFYPYGDDWASDKLGLTLYRMHAEEMIRAFSTSSNKNSIFAEAIKQYIEEGKTLLKENQ